MERGDDTARSTLWGPSTACTCVPCGIDPIQCAQVLKCRPFVIVDPQKNAVKPPGPTSSGYSTIAMSGEVGHRPIPTSGSAASLRRNSSKGSSAYREGPEGALLHYHEGSANTRKVQPTTHACACQICHSPASRTRPTRQVSLTALHSLWLLVIFSAHIIAHNPSCRACQRVLS